MASAANKGTVKSVLSGDTIVVMGAPSNGPPPEKQLTLAGIMCPRLGRRDGASKDEPFAWPAREFLRSKVVGKPCTFELEETVESIGRTFGNVFINGENLAASVVAAGWAKVKEVKGNNAARNAYLEELVQYERQAQEAGVGMWSKSPNAGALSVRNVVNPGPGGYDAKEILEAFKGQTQTLVVEQFRDGGTVRGYMLPGFQWVTVFLSGVSCPGFKRAEEQGGEDFAEPFANEAKYFVESRLLNRDVKVLLEGVDKYNNFYGTLQHPAGNISEELLKVGLGKVVDWSAKFTKDAELLYKAERLAKERRLRIWKDYVPPVRSAAASASAAEFQGKVVEVISGDFLVVKDYAVPPVEHRIALSSTRSPKIGRRDEKDEPYAHEAKEFLRSRLIGRKVTVGIDYIRALPNSPEAERVFASVLEGGNNVAVALVANGLSTVMRHRQDDQDRSLYYDDLIQAEAAASWDKKGMHGDKPPPVRHINDVSTAAAKPQAIQMFTFLQRAGRLQGVVQHVVNGARVKILIPKQSCIVSLAVAGIRCPATGRKDGEPGEAYGEEAYQYTRDKCLQHDVEIEITAQDRGGTMIGRMYLHKRDYASALLHEGYARMSGRDATNEMEEAQAAAQGKRLRTWEKWDSEVEAAKAAEAANEVVENSAGEISQATVSEMVSATEFFVHAAGSAKQLEYIAERLAAMPVDSTTGAWVPKNGEICVAEFSADGANYRARVEGRKGDAFQVSFVDYGNGEEVHKSKMRPMPSAVPSLAQVPPQALDYKLAFVKVPKDAESQRDAMDFVQDMLGASGGVIGAKVEYKERSGRHHVTIVDQETGESLGGMLLRNGLAKLEKRRQDMEGLKDDEAAAKRGHVGIWRYGDAVDSDEDDTRFAMDVAKAKAAVKR